MPGSMGGGESLEQIRDPDRAMSTGELHHHIDVLINKERLPSSRMKLLIILASACGSEASNLHVFTKALTRPLTTRWTCWEEERYSGTEALEWRTCILQAAGDTTGAVKEVTESFISLGTKGITWCTEIVSADLQGRISERELPTGGLQKIRIAALKLITSIFEGMVEKYSPTEPHLPDEPLASLTENLIKSSFAFVEVVYRSSMKVPSLQSSDNESTRKRCHELVNLTFRLVYTFRRQVGGHPPGRTGYPQSEKDEELKSTGRMTQQATSLRIVASSIKALAELGDFATKGGAISLGLLNVSWKSLAALLQMEEGRDVVGSAVNITEILTSLLHHGVQSLKVAVKSWLSSSSLGEKDARRLCIPIKFFLQMAEKISSFYPRGAIMVITPILLSVFKVLASLLLHYKDAIVHTTTLLVLAELVVPSALSILHSLLSARSVEESVKVQLLQLLTCDNDDLWSSHSIADLDGEQEHNEMLDELFNDKPTGLGLLKTGRVAMFVSLLQLSGQYSSSVLSELTLKLDWLLEALLEEGVYVLLTQARLLPVWTADWKASWKYHLMFTWITKSLQTFAGVAARNATIWTELQHFLLENILHPSAICREVILDLWCLIIRQSDSGSVQTHLEILFSLLQDMVSANMDIAMQRRLARVLCILLQEVPEAEAARVHANVFNQDPFSSDSAANLATVLLEEGYSFTLLRGGTRKASMDRFLSSCIAGGKGLVNCLKLDRSFCTSQKQALTCLQLLLLESAFRGEEIEVKYLQEVVVVAEELLSKIIQEVSRSQDCQTDEILSHALQLIPHVQHLLSSSFIQTLLPKLHERSRLIVQNTDGKELKQTLPEFLANLGEIAMTEEEENPAMRALWGLFHLVLKEKHLALVHMGIASFSHFAAHTSCQELWRFVPEDAALALKTNHADPTNDGFMSALKSYMERHDSKSSLALSDEELGFFRNERTLLQEKRSGVYGRASNSDVDEMDIDRASRNTSDIEQALDQISAGVVVLRTRIPTLLAGGCSASHQWQTIRTRLAHMKEELTALQQFE